MNMKCSFHTNTTCLDFQLKELEEKEEKVEKFHKRKEKSFDNRGKIKERQIKEVMLGTD